MGIVRTPSGVGATDCFDGRLWRTRHATVADSTQCAPKPGRSCGHCRDS